MKEIFVITVFEKIEKKAMYSECSRNKGEYLFDIANFGSTRTWGWYSKYEDALEALTNNITDMWEYCYDYACIEGVAEGVIAKNTKMEWFKFNEKTDKYEPFNIPEEFKDVTKCYESFGYIFG